MRIKRLLGIFFGGRNGVTLHEAIRSGDIERAETLISSEEFDSPDARGCTPLYWACQQGYAGIVQRLIAQGANVNAYDREGSTPLRAAVFMNHVSSRVAIVEILLKAKADPNMTHSDGSTPLHIAAEVGDVRVVKLLLTHGADINARHADGEPIYAAAEKNQIPVVLYLIERGASIHVQHARHETLLHALAYQGHDGLVADLISKGLDVNVRNADGRIPLHYAVEEFPHHKNLRVIEQLIAGGSDRAAEDTSGVTPIALAKRHGNRDVVRLLSLSS